MKTGFCVNYVLRRRGVNCPKKLRSRSGWRPMRSIGTAIPEFACGLCAFLLLLFWPLVNVVSFVGAYGIVAMIVSESAAQAVNCGNYCAAQESVRDNGRKIATSNLSKLFGIEHPKIRLSLSCTDVRSGNVSYRRADLKTPPLKREELSNKICDFVVQLDCSIHPLIPVSCDGLRDIPLIGKNVALSCSARRQVERPELLVEESSDETFFVHY